MNELQLVFRSGAEVVVPVDAGSVHLEEDSGTQRLTSLVWAGADGPGELRYVDPAEVAAVIFRDLDEPAAGRR